MRTQTSDSDPLTCGMPLQKHLGLIIYYHDNRGDRGVLDGCIRKPMHFLRPVRGTGHAEAAREWTCLSDPRAAAAGEEMLERVAQAGTIAPLARACTGILRGLPPRKLTAPLDMASAALTVSLSTRRSTVTCCSELLGGCFLAATAPNKPHAEYLLRAT